MGRERLDSEEQRSDGSSFIVPDESRVDLAQWVSTLTTEAKTMLPKSIEEVLEMFKNGDSVFLVDKEGLPIAHASIAFVYENENVVEIGGMIVDPPMRRKGHGFEVTQAAIELSKFKYPNCSRMAFCNSGSLDIFLRLGARKATQEELSLFPEEAWEVCSTCPKRAESAAIGDRCCDTPVIIP